jgi:hypothetical protein
MRYESRPRSTQRGRRDRDEIVATASPLAPSLDNLNASDIEAAVAAATAHRQLPVRELI